jgi:hypothetical protein
MQGPTFKPWSQQKKNTHIMKYVTLLENPITWALISLINSKYHAFHLCEHASFNMTMQCNVQSEFKFE